jgi:hypothetical protein
MHLLMDSGAVFGPDPLQERLDLVERAVDAQLQHQ